MSKPRSNAPQYRRPPPCRCELYGFPHRRTEHCEQIDALRQYPMGKNNAYGQPRMSAADAIHAYLKSISKVPR